MVPFRVVKVAFILGISLFIEGKGNAQKCDTPHWFISAKAATKKLDGTIIATCYAEGPSFAIAYDNANSECTAIGTVGLKSDIHSKTHLIHSESQAAYLKEVNSNACFRGAACTEQKRIQCTEHGIHKVWLQCSLDVSSIETYACSEAQTPTSTRKSAVSDTRIPLQEVGATEVSISSVPLCEDIMVIGGSGRVVKCDSNPTSVSVNKADTKLILRRNGFRPHEIEVNDALLRDKEATVILQKSR